MLPRVLEGVCFEGLTGRGVVVVSRNEVYVQVRDAVSKDQVVHLPRLVPSLDGTSDEHDLGPEPGRLLLREFGRLDGVPTLPDDVGIARPYRKASQVGIGP